LIESKCVDVGVDIDIWLMQFLFSCFHVYLD
jgi:hypothetical protein